MTGSAAYLKMETKDKNYQELEAKVQECCSDSGVVTSWIIVTEVMSPSGNWGINIMHDMNSPSWRYQAMLDVADRILDEGVPVPVDYDGEDDDEDDEDEG
jgi:hypothetical protein